MLAQIPVHHPGVRNRFLIILLRLLDGTKRWDILEKKLSEPHIILPRQKSKEPDREVQTLTSRKLANHSLKWV